MLTLVELLDERGILPNKDVRHIDTRATGGNPGFHDFSPSRKVGLDEVYFFLGGTTASLNAFARRNFTTVFAGILMASPV